MGMVSWWPRVRQNPGQMGVTLTRPALEANLQYTVHYTDISLDVLACVGYQFVWYNKTIRKNYNKIHNWIGAQNKVFFFLNFPAHHRFLNCKYRKIELYFYSWIPSGVSYVFDFFPFFFFLHISVCQSMSLKSWQATVPHIDAELKAVMKDSSIQAERGFLRCLTCVSFK